MLKPVIYKRLFKGAEHLDVRKVLTSGGFKYTPNTRFWSFINTDQDWKVVFKINDRKEVVVYNVQTADPMEKENILQDVAALIKKLIEDAIHETV